MNSRPGLRFPDVTQRPHPAWRACVRRGAVHRALLYSRACAMCVAWRAASTKCRPEEAPAAASCIALSLTLRIGALAPFGVRSFRFQWPADLAASWAFEMEGIILGWYVLV